MLTQIIHVNFSSLTVPHLISVVQGDTGRNLKCIVDDFTLDGTWSATWYVERPSDVPVYNTATIETSDNSVNLELTAQSINEVGDNKLQVRILDENEQVVTSFACILSVKPFGGIDAVESTTESNIFDQQVEEAFDEIDTHKADALEEIDTEIDIHVANGKFPNMAAGDIISDLYAENKVPYFFRPSGGGAEVGTLEAPVLVGGSVGWNQFARPLEATYWDKLGSNVTYTNNTASITATATTTVGIYLKADYRFSVVGHKYLMLADVTASADGYIRFSFNDITSANAVTANTKTRIAKILNEGTADQAITIYKTSNNTVGDTLKAENVQCIDLTLLLGSTIADRLYTLEQSTAGSGIAQLRAWGFDFSKYVPFCAPTLKHVEGVSAHVMRGFNQWDEEWENAYWDGSGNKVSSANYVCSKNKIRIINGTTYYLKFPVAMTIRLYDGNGSLLGSAPSTWKDETIIPHTYQPNAEYMTFHSASSSALTTYNHDICINLSNTAKNGTYEPYRTWSYALDSTLTLRGVPKLDASNNLYFDGDTYEPDGTVTRNCAVRAYQSGDESLADAITDGTNTVYKLSTPTTETATPYAEYQEVDANGTEEYVSTGVVPVGHDTKYPTDLKGAVESILSAIPSANGTYALKVTVANGKHTFSWV